MLNFTESSMPDTDSVTLPSVTSRVNSVSHTVSVPVRLCVAFSGCNGFFFFRGASPFFHRPVFSNLTGPLPQHRRAPRLIFFFLFLAKQLAALVIALAALQAAVQQASALPLPILNQPTPVLSPDATLFRINCGSTSLRDSNGDLWQEDEYNNGGEPYSTSSAILNAEQADQDIYQTSRWKETLIYNLPLHVAGSFVVGGWVTWVGKLFHTFLAPK